MGLKRRIKPITALWLGLLCAVPAIATAQQGESAILEQVRRTLHDDPSLATVTVEYDSGVILLGGEVDSTSIASRAISLARAVPGVQQLQADFSIKEQQAQR